MTRRVVVPRFAFTLIELLVVVGIICLLAALLFPVFGRVRENARKSTCQSNLKQLGMGVMQYTQDADERFPLGITVNDIGECLTTVDLIFPYTKSREIGICPSDEKDKGSVDLTSVFTLPEGSGMSSYTVNDKICTAFGDPTPPSLAIVRDPSRLPLLWDAYIARTDDVSPYVYIEVKRRHLEGANCAFVDSHVKWIPLKPSLSDSKKEFATDYWNASPDEEGVD